MTDSGDNTVAQTPAAPDDPGAGSPSGDFDISRLRLDDGDMLETPAAADTPVGGWRRYRWPLLALALVAVAGLVALLARAPTVETAAVTMAYPSQQFVLLNATGYVVPQLKAAVASKGTGRLEWLGVSEGAVVKKDQVLARLESRDVQSQLENARANVRVAQAAVETAQAEHTNALTTANRFTDLRQKNYVSQAMLDDAQSNARKARANLESAHAALGAAKAGADHAAIAVDYTAIRAPFDGVVLSKTANIGDIVTPMSSAADAKGAVLTMADLTTLQVEADVSEASLAKIKVGQPCEIVLDSIPQTRFRGVVRTIVPTIDRAKATVTTKIGFLDADPRILPEMSARVSFLSRELDRREERPVTALDPAAIVQRDDRHVAYAIWDDRVVEVEVKPGPMLGELLSVESILKAGDRVVLRPGNLHDGEQIKLATPG